MSVIVYLLCALTSSLCAILLLRRYKQAPGVRILLWSGLCFTGLALNNILLFVDIQILPETDLSIVRAIPALIGVCILVFGFIWEAK